MTMSTYETVTLVFSPSEEVLQEAVKEASQAFHCDGIEEFCLGEERVDEILGERALSGGEVPLDILWEVEERLAQEEQKSLKFYFCRENSEGRAQAFRDYITANFPQTQMTGEKHGDQDWNLLWRENYAAIKISPLLEIVPSWEKGRYQSGAKVPLYIYPGMAFGTGGHETTHLCLKIFSDLLESGEISLADKTVLDFGCGSGILGLAAGHWGPRRVDLVDIDPKALENAGENLKLNFLETQWERFRFLLPHQLNGGGGHDLVFANILKNTLREECPFLTGTVVPGGYLILSGLLLDQAQEIIALYQNTPNGLSLRKNVVQGDWCALLMQKAP